MKESSSFRNPGFFRRQAWAAILFLLFLWGMSGCKSREGVGEVNFYCVDQFGSPVPEVEVSINNSTLASDLDGKCVHIVKLSEDQQWIDIQVYKEGFKLLDPEWVLFKKDQKINCTLSMLRRVKATFYAFEDREGEKEPLEVDIYREKDKIGTTDKMTGRLLHYLDPEIQGRLDFHAAYRKKKLTRRFRFPEPSLNRISAIGELDRVFEFIFRGPRKPPDPGNKPSPQPNPDPGPKKPEQRVVLTVVTAPYLHTINAPAVPEGKQEKYSREIYLELQKDKFLKLELALKDKRLFKFPLQIKYGDKKYFLKCYFDKHHATFYRGGVRLKVFKFH